MPAFYFRSLFKTLLPVLVAFALLLLIPTLAKADAGIDSYVRSAEPICKSNTEANARILDGVRSEIKNKQYKAAARQFANAAQALTRTRGQLQSLPVPEGQGDTLQRWFGEIQGIEAGLRKISQALKKENKFLAQRQAAFLMRSSANANSIVIDYRFDYCRFDPSRFVAV